MNTRSLALLCTFALLSGCAAVPSVRYHRIDSAADVRDDQFDTYYLQESFLKLDATVDAKTGIHDMATFNVVSLPAEHTAFKIGLSHADMWGVKTTLTIAKRENTDLVNEVGSQVADNRVELIGKVGSILTKVPFAAGETALVDELPLVVRVQQHLENNKVTRDAMEGVAIRSGITVDFGAVPVDALPIAQIPLDKRTSAYVFAACRSADVKVKLPGGTTYRKSVKISDPRYFQMVSFPLKGKIAAHSECGVSVSSEPNTGIKSNAEVAEAVVTQVLAVQKALENKEAKK